MQKVRICPASACGYATTNPKKRKCPRCGVVLKTEKAQGAKNHGNGHPPRPKRIVSMRV